MAGRFAGSEASARIFPAFDIAVDDISTIDLSNTKPGPCLAQLRLETNQLSPPLFPELNPVSGVRSTLYALMKTIPPPAPQDRNKCHIWAEVDQHLEAN